LKQYHEERKEMKEKLHSESCRNEALVEVHRKEVGVNTSSALGAVLAGIWLSLSDRVFKVSDYYGAQQVLELRDLLTEARETYQLRENSRVSLVDQVMPEYL
jgi:hypothetical protein